jgi:hypothetical protein
MKPGRYRDYAANRPAPNRRRPLLNGGIVTSRQPWDVRHIHTQAAGFKKYLDKLHKELDTRADADSGCIRNRLTCPVDRNSDVGYALQASGESELVIVDLHGWVDERGPWLGVIRRPSVWLQDLAPKSWAASTVFLTGCRGGTDEFAAELDRVLARPATVVSHSGEAMEWDHTPIELIVAVLEQAAGADADGAYEVVDNILRARPSLREEGWKVDRRGPGAGLGGGMPGPAHAVVDH